MDNRLLTDHQVAAALGLGRSTVWRWVTEGRLPQPVRLSGKCTRWRAADIEAFVAQTAESAASESI